MIVVLEQGLLNNDQLECAVHLLSLVSSENLLPFEAAQVLRKVTATGASVYEALACEQVNRAIRENETLRLGDLLVEANLVEANSLENILAGGQPGSVKIGKVLLGAGLIKESTLFKALRCQSLWRYGFISRQVSVEALRKSEVDHDRLETTFGKMELYVPSSMQWSWV